MITLSFRPVYLLQRFMIYMAERRMAVRRFIRKLEKQLHFVRSSISMNEIYPTGNDNMCVKLFCRLLLQL